MNKLDSFLSRVIDWISDYISTHRGVPVCWAWRSSC